MGQGSGRQWGHGQVEHYVLERLVGKGKAGARRVAQVEGGKVDVMGRTVRAGAESRCSIGPYRWVHG